MHRYCQKYEVTYYVKGCDVTGVKLQVWYHMHYIAYLLYHIKVILC